MPILGNPTSWSQEGDKWKTTTISQTSKSLLYQLHNKMFVLQFCVQNSKNFGLNLRISTEAKKKYKPKINLAL